MDHIRIEIISIFFSFFIAYQVSYKVSFISKFYYLRTYDFITPWCLTMFILTKETGKYNLENILFENLLQK